MSGEEHASAAPSVLAPMTGRARLQAALRREEAEVLEACAEAEDRLTAAREAWEQYPTPETLAAFETAQAEMYRLRSFLRAAAQEKAAREAAELAERARKARSSGNRPDPRLRGRARRATARGGA